MCSFLCVWIRWTARCVCIWSLINDTTMSSMVSGGLYEFAILRKVLYCLMNTQMRARMQICGVCGTCFESDSHQHSCNNIIYSLFVGLCTQTHRFVYIHLWVSIYARNMHVVAACVRLLCFANKPNATTRERAHEGRPPIARVQSSPGACTLNAYAFATPTPLPKCVQYELMYNMVILLCDQQQQGTDKYIQVNRVHDFDFDFILCLADVFKLANLLTLSWKVRLRCSVFP